MVYEEKMICQIEAKVNMTLVLIVLVFIGKYYTTVFVLCLSVATNYAQECNTQNKIQGHKTKSQLKKQDWSHYTKQNTSTKKTKSQCAKQNPSAQNKISVHRVIRSVVTNRSVVSTITQLSYFQYLQILYNYTTRQNSERIRISTNLAPDWLIRSLPSNGLVTAKNQSVRLFHGRRVDSRNLGNW